MRVGETNVERNRNKIRDKRKLWVSQSTGRWTEKPSDRFVNEHAWVLAKMNIFGMIPHVDRRTKATSLLPGAEEKLSAVDRFFQEKRTI